MIPNTVQRSARRRCNIIETRSWRWAHYAIYALGVAAAAVVWVTR